MGGVCEMRGKNVGKEWEGCVKWVGRMCEMGGRNV